MYTIIIILLLFLVIALYVSYQLFFMKRHHKKSIDAVDAAYKRVIKRYKLTISLVNKFINRVIALDRTNGTLILIVYKNDVIWETCLNLSEIKTVKVVRSLFDANNINHTVTMEFGLRNSNETISFPFFEAGIDDSRVVTKHLKQSQHWQRKLLRCIYIAPTADKQLQIPNPS